MQACIVIPYLELVDFIHEIGQVGVSSIETAGKGSKEIVGIRQSAVMVVGVVGHGPRNPELVGPRPRALECRHLLSLVVALLRWGRGWLLLRLTVAKLQPRLCLGCLGRGLSW